MVQFRQLTHLTPITASGKMATSSKIRGLYLGSVTNLSQNRVWREFADFSREFFVLVLTSANDKVGIIRLNICGGKEFF